MKIGTKTVLFGVHQFILHPLLVARAWKKIYGKYPRDYRTWIAFFLHDLGYIGCKTIDGKDGKLHPLFAAKIMSALFDGNSKNKYWYNFCAGHSRSLARKLNIKPSELCAPDKLSINMYPIWLYLFLSNLSGEIDEYMYHADTEDGRKVGIVTTSQKDWLISTRIYMEKVVFNLKNKLEAGTPPVKE